MMPAAAPWTTRNWISAAADGAIEHSNEATTKRAIAPAKACRAPKRRRNQPVSVAITAEAQR